MVSPAVIDVILLGQTRGKTNKKATNAAGIVDNAALEKLSESLLAVKKVILSWFLSSKTKIAKQKKLERETKLCKTEDCTPKLDAPDFSSVLDGETTLSDQHRPNGTFIDILMCLLFLYKPDSEQIKFLLQAGSNSNSCEAGSLSEEKKIRIQACMSYGCHIDNAVFHIIINSVVSNDGPLDARDAICLIEQMLYQCKDSVKVSILVNDCDVIWDLYKITKYIPNVSDSSIPE